MSSKSPLSQSHNLRVRLLSIFVICCSGELPVRHHPMSDHSASESSATPGPPASGTTKRRPIPRKGHTKSRGGCSSCKRRKVKCDEVSPECGPCLRLGLECEYQPKQRRSRAEPSTSVSRPLRTTPAMFDVNDINFFRHFLFEAYPPLPIDGFSVWQDVSRLSHEVSPSQRSLKHDLQQMDSMTSCSTPCWPLVRPI